MIDSFLKAVQGWVRIKGDTTGTMIGNTQDRLNTIVIQPAGIARTITTGVNYINKAGQGSLTPLLCVRKRSGQGSQKIKIVGATCFIQSWDEALIQLCIGGTITGGTWSNISTKLEFNASPASITGGTIVSSISGRGANSMEAIDMIQQIATAAWADLQNNDVFSILVTNLTWDVSYLGTIDVLEVD